MSVPSQACKVNGPSHEMCVGADPSTELVQLVVFLDGRSWPLVFLRWPLNQDGAEESWALDRIRQVRRLRLSRTGRPFDRYPLNQLSQANSTCLKGAPTQRLEGNCLDPTRSPAPRSKKQPGFQPKNWRAPTPKTGLLAGIPFNQPSQANSTLRRLGYSSSLFIPFPAVRFP